MSHASAAALLDRVHHTEDPQVVQRVITLVDTEGVDIIAQLWSNAEPDSLPGIMWRLYLLRTWMRRNREQIARLWRFGEPVATTASAIVGVDETPDAEDIARTADSILSGAFTGDFAVALDRASAFTDVIANGLRVQAHRITAAQQERTSSSISDGDERLAAHDAQTRAARLMHTAANLLTTSRDFREGAHLWRRGRLE
ncbi:short-chain dehydrogenase/reductase SDR [Bifidobacterium apri]|uniref:Short-chain dehydrogenase/reductase SDR n=2 Tax=Bifidobacterium apri TaxID=1769423 RepID=A0A6A2VFI1_9BIFI|nr:short-chain dehydrogenase/reductase SDR [Bifidobacterium apri]